MKRYILNLCFLVLLLSLSVPAFASDLVPDKLVLRADENLGIIYSHALKKNQTIYGLSKFFNTDIDRIAAANPGVNLSTIKLNQQINIPINKNMITSERNLSPKKSYIPVFYTVKAKDNLFRVAKVYLDQSIDNVMKINKLTSMELSVGQRLLVGWYEYNPVYKERLAWNQKGIEVSAQFTAQEDDRPTRTDIHILPTTSIEDDRKKRANGPMKFEKVVSTRNEPLPNVEEMETVKEELPAEQTDEKTTLNTNTIIEESAPSNTEVEILNVEEEIVEERIPSMDPFENRNDIFQGTYEGKPVIKNSKIRAQWNSKSKDKVNLFALHATAKTNSYIEIYNPMLDRKVIAKVVGNIPPKAFKKNVELIVSPKVAETLGAKDKKFFVKIRYIE